MNANDLKDLSTYVRFMKADIAREISWYRSGTPAGQLLCGLGLVVYTEVLGRILRWNYDRPNFYTTDDREELYRHFNAFFDNLSQSHARWRIEWEARHPKTDIYESLRCGLVHEYAPKVDSEFRMAGAFPLGIGEEGDILVFEVEAYFDAFAGAADALLVRLMNDTTSSLPPTKYRLDQS